MKKKTQWHLENKTAAYKLTGGKCSKCTHVGKFSIHHKTYKQIKGESIYTYSFEELLKMNLVEVLCYNCHKKEHAGDNLDTCFYCKKLTEKTRGESLKLEIVICRKCFRSKGGLKGNFSPDNDQLSLF